MDNNFLPHNIRTAAILTNSYVAGHTIYSKINDNELVVYIAFTKGSLTSAEIKVDFYDKTQDAWFQETFSTISAGTETDSIGEHTISATGNYRLLIPVKDSDIRISAKGTGTVTGSSMAISSVTGNTN